jgi:hypothetical protein
MFFCCVLVKSGRAKSRMCRWKDARDSMCCYGGVSRIRRVRDLVMEVEWDERGRVGEDEEKILYRMAGGKKDERVREEEEM